MFSKERRLRSNQTIHNKYPGIKFQIFELCFPSHWCQQDNKPAVVLGITQCTPKAWSMKDHKECVTGQWSKRWTTDSPSPQHIQHRFTKMRSLSMRLSKVRIRLCAAVHKKKATRLGILGFHTPFQVLPNKFFHLKSISATHLGITQGTSINENPKNHNSWATARCTNYPQFHQGIRTCNINPPILWFS